MSVISSDADREHCTPVIVHSNDSLSALRRGVTECGLDRQPGYNGRRSIKKIKIAVEVFVGKLNSNK